MAIGGLSLNLSHDHPLGVTQPEGDFQISQAGLLRLPKECQMQKVGQPQVASGVQTVAEQRNLVAKGCLHPFPHLEFVGQGRHVGATDLDRLRQDNPLPHR
jgi:hypothetical protein